MTRPECSLIFLWRKETLDRIAITGATVAHCCPDLDISKSLLLRFFVPGK